MTNAQAKAIVKNYVKDVRKAKDALLRLEVGGFTLLENLSPGGTRPVAVDAGDINLILVEQQGLPDEP